MRSRLGIRKRRRIERRASDKLQEIERNYSGGHKPEEKKARRFISTASGSILSDSWPEFKVN